MAADGPAAGDKRLQTSSDPSGKRIIGTFNNCTGGVTPWNTYLTAEENFHLYFWTDQRDADNQPPAGLGGDQAASAAYATKGPRRCSTRSAESSFIAATTPAANTFIASSPKVVTTRTTARPTCPFLSNDTLYAAR